MILVRTDHPCLRVRYHRWYQSHYRYNALRTILFLKTYGEDTLRCLYKNIVALIGGKLTWIYFLYFLSVMTHRWQSKKVSILPSGDVNPGPVPSRRGLLEDSLYHAVGAVVRHATSHDRTPRACGDLGVFCGALHKAWIRSCNVCSVVHAASNTWVPHEG
jgi:hypothetical protein